MLSKIRQSAALMFWLVLFLLVAVAGTCSIVLPMHVVRAKKRLEPEVVIRPENAFERTLRVVGDVDYKPFSYFHGDESDPHGYDIETVAELANRMKVNLDLKLMEWNDAVEQIQKKEADLILGCDWQDASVMDCSFTIPTFEEKIVAFELEPTSSFSDLYEKKIAVIEGCGLKETLMHYQLWPNCTEYDTVTDCVQAVLDGRCDSFIAHHTIGEVSLQTFGKDGKRFRGRMDIASGQMCFGVSVDEPELFEVVNATLLEMRADGTMDRLAEKWLERFDADVTLVEYMRRHPFVFFLIFDLLLAVVVVFLVMNHFLIKIRREKDRAIAAERSKSLFFSTVSHDIRTPLNAIIGFSEMLRNGGIEDKEEQKQAFDAIETSGQTLLDLINDILDLSKLDAGKFVFASELTDVGKLASCVLHSFDVFVFGRDVALVEKIEPIPSLYVDPHRIRQILFNLLGNAVKFTEHGSITLSASFVENPASTEETGCLTFSVSDTGRGIAEEDQENILKPFVQAKNTKAGKGTGLGLSICSQLAERMGGKLSLKSVLGKGSTFTVTFPNVRFSTKEKPKAVELTGLVQIQAAQKALSAANVPRILVVDDVPVNVKVIQSMLRRLDITDVVTAGNGAEALEMLQNDEKIGIVMTDMWMPVMNGEELIREIRRQDRWKDLRVYAVTADVETQKTYRDSGFTGILLKPIKLSQLQTIIG